MCKDKKIMGIINVNDDSFYGASRVSSVEEFRAKVLRMAADGADIIDVGACSSRSGSIWCGEEEEWRRLEPMLEEMAKMRLEGLLTSDISIDTFSAEIVRKAYGVIGRFIVNDISAGEEDPKMLPLVGKLGLPYIAMHKRGLPDSMDSLCDYDDVVAEVIAYFREFAAKAKAAGIDEWILDPGFGFAKNSEQNLEMIHRLSEFKALGHPVLVGISRKRFLREPLGLTAEDALDATTTMHRIALDGGADILRVHDVAEAKALLLNYSLEAGSTMKTSSPSSRK